MSVRTLVPIPGGLLLPGPPPAEVVVLVGGEGNCTRSFNPRRCVTRWYFTSSKAPAGKRLAEMSR